MSSFPLPPAVSATNAGLVTDDSSGILATASSSWWGSPDCDIHTDGTELQSLLLLLPPLQQPRPASSRVLHRGQIIFRQQLKVASPNASSDQCCHLDHLLLRLLLNVALMRFHGPAWQRDHLSILPREHRLQRLDHSCLAALQTPSSVSSRFLPTSVLQLQETRAFPESSSPSATPLVTNSFFDIFRSHGLGDQRYHQRPQTHQSRRHRCKSASS